jgi:hypothetical protein
VAALSPLPESPSPKQPNQLHHQAATEWLAALTSGQEAQAELMAHEFEACFQECASRADEDALDFEISIATGLAARYHTAFPKDARWQFLTHVSKTKAGREAFLQADDVSFPQLVWRMLNNDGGRKPKDYVETARSRLTIQRELLNSPKWACDRNLQTLRSQVLRDAISSLAAIWFVCDERVDNEIVQELNSLLKQATFLWPRLGKAPGALLVTNIFNRRGFLRSRGVDYGRTYEQQVTRIAQCIGIWVKAAIDDRHMPRAAKALIDAAKAELRSWAEEEKPELMAQVWALCPQQVKPKGRRH